MDCNQPFRRPAGFSLFAYSLILTVTFALGGCESNSISDIEDLQTVSVFSQGDQLSRTMEYIQSLERYEAIEFRDKVNSGLNRWITSVDAQEESDRWRRTELLDSLPDPVKDCSAFLGIASESFSSNDANFVQQAYWIKSLASRIVDEHQIWSFQPYFQQAIKGLDDQAKRELGESNDLLVESVKRLHPDLSDNPQEGSATSPVDQLSTALKFFDWTVRNVQLMETPSWPSGDELRKLATAKEITDESWPPSTGAPGPGYVRYPWQVLTYGKGDQLDRMEVFLLLCAQIDLDACVLAVESEEGSTRPYREWVAAVLIQDRLFLFDMELGLPIPGKRPGSVATLTDVVEEPELLRSLDLSVEESIDKMDYWVLAEDLQNVTALILGSPESLSKRMAIMESKLTGDSRLRLTLDVGPLGNATRRPPAVGTGQVVAYPVLGKHVSPATRGCSADSKLRPGCLGKSHVVLRPGGLRR